MITELEAGKTYKLIDKEDWIANAPRSNGEVYNHLDCDNLLIDSVDEDGKGFCGNFCVITEKEYEFFEEVVDSVGGDVTNPFNDPFMKLKKDKIAKQRKARKERLQRVEDLLGGTIDEEVTHIKTQSNNDGTAVHFFGKKHSLDKALAELADLGRQAVEDYNKLCQNASEAPEHGCNCSQGGCSCEGDKVADSVSGEVLELFKGPIKSDGGSSSYYDIKLPQKVVDFVKENGYIKTEQIIEALGSDFDIGNMMKCTVRINSLMNGVGKEGNNVSYDASKIIYSANRLKERN